MIVGIAEAFLVSDPAHQPGSQRQKGTGSGPNDPRPIQNSDSLDPCPILPRPPTTRSAAWSALARLGPAPFLAVVLGCTTLLFVGCLRLAEFASGPEPEETRIPSAPHVDRLIRVRLLGRAPVADGRLAVTGPYSIHDARSGAPLFQGTGPLGLCLVRPDPDARGVYIGGRRLDSDDLVVTPVRDGGITLARPTRRAIRRRTYRGRLRITRQGDRLTFTNLVDVESYLLGVLRGELPRSFHPNSFKAQAVAARTYVLFQKGEGPTGRSFDVLDNEGSQMYIGVQGEDRVAVAAVRATRGEVCVWNDGGDERIFCTYYSSTCGGRSQSVEHFRATERPIPPLAGNVVCEDCAVSAHYRWGPVRLSRDEVTRRIVARYPSIRKIGPIRDLIPKGLTAGGRIIRIQLNGSSGENETLMGEDFRLSIGGRTLKSTCFTIETDGRGFVFANGRGFGHGVGLCQYGMDAKASRGMNYQDILAVYYPGSTVKKLY